MRLSAIASIGALTIASSPTQVVSGATCTLQQFMDFKNQQGNFPQDCKPLWDNDFRTETLPTLNATQLEGIAGCAQPTCLTNLKNTQTIAPDCGNNGENQKRYYAALLTMCETLATGPLTKQAIVELFKDTTDDSADWSGSISTEEVTTPPTSDANKTTNGISSPTTAPVVTPKSSASTAMLASAATAVLTTVAATVL